MVWGKDKLLERENEGGEDDGRELTRLVDKGKQFPKSNSTLKSNECYTRQSIFLAKLRLMTKCF